MKVKYQQAEKIKSEMIARCSREAVSCWLSRAVLVTVQACSCDTLLRVDPERTEVGASVPKTQDESGYTGEKRSRTQS